jgi:hypothetical protein
MRRVVGVIGRFALALACVVGCATGCTSSSSSSAGTVPSMSAVRSLLGSLAAAVRHRDESAFLADLDPAFPAFRGEQRSDFASLARLPLQTWRYQVVGPITDPAANRAVRARYHVPVRLVHVTLLSAFKNVEPEPSRHDQYLVVTEHGGHTYLAGDDALTNESINSWAGPWRYGPLIAVAGTRSLVLGPPSDRATLHGLAAQVDAAIPQVTRVWGGHWSQRVVVIVPTAATEFAALTGSGVREVSAAAVTDGIDSGTDRPYGQRLVINPTQFDKLSALGRRIVLEHEITHLASAADTADITPRWLVEGLAEYVANLGTGQPVRVAASELARSVAAGDVPRALPADGAFAGAGAAQYEQSWLACRLIAARAGQAGLLRFYRSIGRALAPRAEAVAAAFRDVLHEDQAAFTRQWQAYLKNQLG